MSKCNLRLSDAPGRRPSITPDNAGRTPPTSSPIHPYPLTVADDDRARVGARHIGMANIRVYFEYVVSYGYTCHELISVFCIRMCKRWFRVCVMFGSIWNVSVFGTAAARGAFGELVDGF
jgi:hypothetical protein